MTPAWPYLGMCLFVLFTCVLEFSFGAFPSELLFQNVRFRSFASQLLFQNLRFGTFVLELPLHHFCFRTFVSEIWVQNFCFVTFVSDISLRKLCFRTFASELLLGSLGGAPISEGGPRNPPPGATRGTVGGPSTRWKVGGTCPSARGEPASAIQSTAPLSHWVRTLLGRA